MSHSSILPTAGRKRLQSELGLNGFRHQSASCLVGTKPGSNCYQLPLKAPKQDREEKQEVTTSLAAAREISADAAVAAVLAELDGIFM